MKLDKYEEVVTNAAILGLSILPFLMIFGVV